MSECIVFLLVIPKCHQDSFPLHCGRKHSREWLWLKVVHSLLVPLHLVLNLFQIFCSSKSFKAKSQMWRAVNMNTKTVISSAGFGGNFELLWWHFRSSARAHESSVSHIQKHGSCNTPSTCYQILHLDVSRWEELELTLLEDLIKSASVCHA